MLGNITRWIRIGALACLLAGVSGITYSQPFHAGPLFDQFDLTLSLGTGAEAAGPLFAWEQQPHRTQWSIHPAVTHTWHPDSDGEEIDFLYPLMTYDRYAKEYRWQFLQVVSFTGGTTQQEEMVRRFYFAPFYFQQRGPEPKDNYTALFPFYGTIRNKFMRDEVHFVMFPIYGQSRKKDVVTDNYLFPFFHLRHGDGLSGWQLWPLVGAEHKAVTTRTNQMEFVETIGGHEKLFVLWPFFFNEHTGLGTDDPTDFHALLPFYSLYRSPKRDVTSYLWPFFNYTDEREQKYREWDFLWPLWVIARGEGKTITRAFPFYTYGRTPSMESVTYLWPIYRQRHQFSPTFDRYRVEFGLWLYSRVDEKNVTTGATMHRTDVWPLLTQRRSPNGDQRLQILALLEPILPANKSVERNWSALWSLWRSEKNAATGATSQSLLWNLYRRDTTPETKRVSFLLGLFQYRKTKEETTCRLFFIPITKKKAAAK